MAEMAVKFTICCRDCDFIIYLSLYELWLRRSHHKQERSANSQNAVRKDSHITCDTYICIGEGWNLKEERDSTSTVYHRPPVLKMLVTVWQWGQTNPLMFSMRPTIGRSSLWQKLIERLTSAVDTC